MVETVTFPDQDRVLHGHDGQQSCSEKKHSDDDTYSAHGIGAQRLSPSSPECSVEPQRDIADGVKLARTFSVGNDTNNEQAEDTSVELVWCHSRQDFVVGQYYWMNKERTWCNRSVNRPRKPPPLGKGPPRADFEFDWEPVDPLV